MEERFESRVLPLFERQTKESAELVVQLYLHGLAEGDFKLALRGLLGDGGAAVEVHGATPAGEVDDWDRMTAFFDFPAAHWTHLRTTNVVESPFAAVRLRTSAAKRVEGATALIWKLLMVAEKRFRKLNAPHLLPGVLRGDRYEDGQPVPEEEEERRAA